MKEEKIIRIGKLVYSNIIPSGDEDLIFEEDGKRYYCSKIIGNFYWIIVSSAFTIINSDDIRNAIIEQNIIDKFFYPRSMFGNRNCKYNSDTRSFRINKMQELEIQYDIAWGYKWEKITWKVFNEFIKLYLENERRESEANDITKLDWEF